MGLGGPFQRVLPTEHLLPLAARARWFEGWEGGSIGGSVLDVRFYDVFW